MQNTYSYVKKEQNMHYKNPALWGAKTLRNLLSEFSACRMKTFAFVATVHSCHDQITISALNVQVPPTFDDLGHAPADRAQSSRVQSKRKLGFSTGKQFSRSCKDGPQLFVSMFVPASEDPPLATQRMKSDSNLRKVFTSAVL